MQVQHHGQQEYISNNMESLTIHFPIYTNIYGNYGAASKLSFQQMKIELYSISKSMITIAALGRSKEKPVVWWLDRNGKFTCAKFVGKAAGWRAHLPYLWISNRANYKIDEYGVDISIDRFLLLNSRRGKTIRTQLEDLKEKLGSGKLFDREVMEEYIFNDQDYPEGLPRENYDLPIVRFPFLYRHEPET